MKAENNSARTVQIRPDDDARSQVSALVDGELDPASTERALDALLASDDLVALWADAHRAGDWMRSDEVVGVGDSGAFMRRFCARLAAEPTVLAPQPTGPSASRRFWLRTGLPGASIAAALVAVVWVAAPFGNRDGAADRVASVEGVAAVVAGPASSPVVAEQVVKTVDADQLSDYLAAHRDVTPFGYRGASARPAAYSPPSASADTIPSR